MHLSEVMCSFNQGVLIYLALLVISHIVGLSHDECLLVPWPLKVDIKIKFIVEEKLIRY